MGLYPGLESGSNHRLQHLAGVGFRLEKERDFRASLCKKYRRGVNVIDGIDTALFVTSVGLAASGIGLLATIIAAPGALGLQARAIGCGLLGASGKFISQNLQAKARKHDQIRVLAESKLNSIADRISVALNDDQISEEEFRLILSEVDKYNQMKDEIRRRQKQDRGLSEDDKKRSYFNVRNTKQWWQPVRNCWKSFIKLEAVAPLNKYFLLTKLAIAERRLVQLLSSITVFFSSIFLAIQEVWFKKEY